jgi:hypothetical protein
MLLTVVAGRHSADGRSSFESKLRTLQRFTERSGFVTENLVNQSLNVQ